MESVIEEDRPRIMASGRSYDINNYPLEEHTNGERGGFEDHNESYLTYYSGEYFGFEKGDDWVEDCH